MIDFRTLVKAGVHFGHQTSRWMPKMDPYIWGVKNKVHLIDVSKTAYQLERSAQFLKEVASEGKQILWVGTKKPARQIIQLVATKLGMPFVNHRWIGGTLSNFTQVKKSVTRLLHFEDVLEKSEKYPHYTKKELNEIQKNVERLKSIVGGIRKLKMPLGAIVLVDVNKEQSALREACTVGVPVVALVDTNSDPSLVDYVIPANDDAPRSIKVIIDYLEKAVEEGKQATAKKEQKAEEAKAVKKDSKVATAAPKESKKEVTTEKPKTPVQASATKAVADTQDAQPKPVAKEEKVTKEASAIAKKKPVAKKAAATTVSKKETAEKQQKAE